MSIIPVGNRKDQVNQGPLQNQSILDSVLFKKFGHGAARLIDNPVQNQKPDMQSGTSELDDAMMQGGLNAPGQADKHEQQVDPMNQDPSSTQGVAPAGGLSPFLTSLENPMEQQQQPMGAIDTIRWVQSLVQGKGFIINVKDSGNGQQVTILPNPELNVGFNWDLWEGILEQLKRVGVSPKDVQYKNNSASFTLDQGNSGKQVQKR